MSIPKGQKIACAGSFRNPTPATGANMSKDADVRAAPLTMRARNMYMAPNAAIKGSLPEWHFLKALFNCRARTVEDLPAVSPAIFIRIQFNAMEQSGLAKPRWREGLVDSTIPTLQLLRKCHSVLYLQHELLLTSSLTRTRLASTGDF